MSNQDNPQKFYYAIRAADRAYSYNDPAGIAIVETGNTSSYFYVKSEIQSIKDAEKKTPSSEEISLLENGEIDSRTILVSSGVDLPKLKTIRKPGTALDAAKSGSFAIDPKNIHPAVSIDGFTFFSGISDGFDENISSPRSYLRITVDQAPSQMAINTSSLRVSLFEEDETLDSADGFTNPLTISPADVTPRGSSVQFSYFVPKRGDSWIVQIDGVDSSNQAFRNNRYAFTINEGAPNIESVNPSTGKIRPSVVAGENRVTATVKAHDDNKQLGIKMKESTADTYTVLDIFPVSQTEDPVNGGWDTTWSVVLPAAVEGSSVSYDFQVFETAGGSNDSNPVTRNWTSDTIAPVLSAVTLPVFTSGTFGDAGAGSILQNANGFLLEAVSSADLALAQVAYTTTDATPALTNGTWKTVVPTDTTDGDGNPARKFVTDFVLKKDNAEAQGRYYVWYRLADDCFDQDNNYQYGPVTRLSEVFVDSGAPVLTETAIGSTDTVYRNAGYSISGTASDPNGITSITGTRNGTVVTLSVTNVNATTKNWSFTETSTVNGTNEYRVVATDAAGRTTELVRTVIYDNVKPVVAVSNPSEGGAITTALASLFGSVTEDGSGIASVEYRLNDTPAGQWLNPLGQSPWTVNFTATTEGPKTLTVRATDRAGNVSDSVVRSFFVDKNIPALSETGVDTTDIVPVSGSFTFSGTTQDSYGIKSLSYTVTKDSDPVSSAVSIVGGWGVQSNQSYNWSLGPLNLSESGTYRYQFVATDLADQAS
ncbi:MAG TPA: Ig-like domain-containing protein, partial [Treponemataceae bacterium]|nr:Ig-like domain-containing protein [Treponemataceae bacterium]